MSQDLFVIDQISIILLALVTIIGTTVVSFSMRYMAGDKRRFLYFLRLALLIASLVLLALSNHLLLFGLSLIVANCLLVQLMMHNRQWPAAANAGYFAARYFAFGFMALFISFALLYLQATSFSMTTIFKKIDPSDTLTVLSLVSLLVAAMIQSAIFPFHRWLLSSLNSPTPVSAFMHAGLVNGGSILLIRFAPLYLSHENLLVIIFSIGFTTATLGTLWKLQQSSVKSMLACSTIAQMGYALMQFGLGLLPAAIMHMFSHGLFKANLFLSSSSALSQQNKGEVIAPTLTTFISAVICGLVGTAAYANANHCELLPYNSITVLQIVVMITITQFALTLLHELRIKLSLIVTLFSCLAIGTAYGAFLHALEQYLAPMHLLTPQPLHVLHYIGMAILILFWLFMIFRATLAHNYARFVYASKLYVNVLNASQPDATTVTSNRSSYEY